MPLYTVSICSYFATVRAGIGSIKKVCKKNASLVPFYALCGHRFIEAHPGSHAPGKWLKEII